MSLAISRKKVEWHLFFYLAVLRSSQFSPKPNLFPDANIYSANHMVPTHTWRHVDMVEMTCWRSNKASQWGKKGDLDDFERGMVVGLRILDTADLLEFSLTTIFSGLLRMIRKELLQFSGWKCLNVRGEWPGCNKQDIQKSISKCWTLKKDGLQKKILLGISSN